MKLIIKDRYNEIKFDESAHLHYHIMKDATSDMSEEELKNLLFIWKESVFKLRPKFLLIDSRDLDFPISPDFQNWITDNIAQPVANLEEVRKVCYVIPDEFISKLSITQLTGDHKEVIKSSKFKYVATIEEAKQWFTDEPELLS